MKPTDFTSSGSHNPDAPFSDDPVHPGTPPHQQPDANPHLQRDRLSKREDEAAEWLARAEQAGISTDAIRKTYGYGEEAWRHLIDENADFHDRLTFYRERLDNLAVRRRLQMESLFDDAHNIVRGTLTDEQADAKQRQDMAKWLIDRVDPVKQQHEVTAHHVLDRDDVDSIREAEARAIATQRETAIPAVANGSGEPGTEH